MENPVVGPRDAASSLSAVEASRLEAERLAAAGAAADARYYAQLGALMAVLGLVVGLTAHTHPWVMVAGIVGYGVVMQVVVYRHQRSARATARGWSARFASALGVTSTLYALGIIGAATEVVPPRVAIWVPYAVLTAAPLLIAASVRRRAR